jgi:branched-chain amino acid transport system substrate-binding protein
MSLKSACLGLAAAVALAFPAAAQTILIGAGQPITGAAAAAAVWQRWGFDIALDQINKSGGLLGHQVELRAYDDQCNPSAAVNITNRLIEDKVVAILGMHCSSATLAAMPLVDKAHIPLIEAVATTPKITELSGVGGNIWTFRINPSDQDMMVALGRYLAQSTQMHRIALLGEDTDFGRGGAAAFTAVAQGDGLQVISTDFHPQNLPDFTSILTRIQQTRPDAIALFDLAGDQINLLRTAMQLGMHIPYTGRFDPGGSNVKIIQAGGMEGSITAWTYSAEIDTPENKILVDETKKRFDSVPVLQTWAGYDTMRLAAEAIKEAGSTDPDKIRQALTTIHFRNALGKDVHFDDHNQGGRTVVIEKIQDRKVNIEKLLDLDSK